MTNIEKYAASSLFFRFRRLYVVCIGMVNNELHFFDFGHLFFDFCGGFAATVCVCRRHKGTPSLTEIELLQAT